MKLLSWLIKHVWLRKYCQVYPKGSGGYTEEMRKLGVLCSVIKGEVEAVYNGLDKVVIDGIEYDVLDCGDLDQALDGAPPDEVWCIKPVWMTEAKFDALPEFEGF